VPLAAYLAAVLTVWLSVCPFKVVGRGGQAVLAFYSWKAFSNYFRSSMQTGPITYDSFFTVFIESEASLTSTFRITRDFATRRGLRSRVAMTCTILTMAFVLAWPTIAAAMTGYTSAIGAYVRDEENYLIPLSNFSTVAYVIHDGTRVNLTKDHLVPFIAYNPHACKAVEPHVRIRTASGFKPLTTLQMSQ
jgi:hypothetical protein